MPPDSIEEEETASNQASGEQERISELAKQLQEATAQIETLKKELADLRRSGGAAAC